MLMFLRRLAIFIMILWPGLAFRAVSVRADSWHVTVRGVDAGLNEAPVVAPLKIGVPVGSYVMAPSSGGGILPAQVFEDGGSRYLCAVFPRGTARENVTYSLGSTAVDNPAFGSALSIEPNGKNLKVMLGGHLLTE